MIEKSATARIREEMETVLKKKRNENGLTFNELWNMLEVDKLLKKSMYNRDNKKREGLLQGISKGIRV